MKKIVLAYSGGLDTSYCLASMAKQGNEVHAVSVNTGGFSSTEIEEMKSKALQMGAKQYHSIDALESFYSKIIKYLIFGNVLRNNTYPLSVSAERIIQAIEVVNYAKKIDADAIAHGSTGAGNDQVRFDMIFQILGAKFDIITPIRDGKLSRQEEIDYLNSQGINMSWEKSKYSINKGIWGTSIGGDETLGSRLPLPEDAYLNSCKEKESKGLVLEFEKGELTSLNDEKMNSIAIIERIEALANEYAIGRDIHVGDSIIGLKGRVGFQAAAPLIIIKSHHLLEKHTLSKWQLFQKEQQANFYGMMLHEGHYLDPVMRDIEAYLSQSQQCVSGKVFVRLSPYRFELEGIESAHDLMNKTFGVYGESNDSWSAEDAKGFIKISSNSHTNYYKTNGYD